MTTSWLTPVRWVDVDGVWMAKQALAGKGGSVGAVVGKVWKAKDTTKGNFYYAAGAWCMGREVNGYTETLIEAKRKVQEEADSCTYYKVQNDQAYGGA